MSCGVDGLLRNWTLDKGQITDKALSQVVHERIDLRIYKACVAMLVRLVYIFRFKHLDTSA